MVVRGVSLSPQSREGREVGIRKKSRRKKESAESERGMKKKKRRKTDEETEKGTGAARGDIELSGREGCIGMSRLFSSLKKGRKGRGLDWEGGKRLSGMGLTGQGLQAICRLEQAWYDWVRGTLCMGRRRVWRVSRCLAPGLARKGQVKQTRLEAELDKHHKKKQTKRGRSYEQEWALRYFATISSAVSYCSYSDVSCVEERPMPSKFHRLEPLAKQKYQGGPAINPYYEHR